jgi:molybdopterin synthase catalytic subunit
LFRSVLEDVGDGSAGAAVFFVGLVKRQGNDDSPARRVW